MYKDNNRVLVFGKFMPLHKGHWSLIEHAFKRAKQLDILVMAEVNEPISGKQRVQWIKDQIESAILLDKDTIKVSLLLFSATQTGLNPSSNSDKDSSKKWVDYLNKYCPVNFNNHDMVIGSEPYIEYCAKYAGIDYEIYDEKRENIPISATDIKKYPFKYWDYLCPPVKRTYAKHICICGSESSGKTTVCRQLEDISEAITVIPEIGRCLVGNAATVSESTLSKVFKIEKDLLESVKNDPPTPIIVWDTDNITTLSYYRFLFGKSMRISSDNIPKADKYFFFENDIPYHKDATRLDEEKAKELSDFHFGTYNSYGIMPERVNGDKFSIVKDYIDSYLKSFSFSTN